MPLTNQQLDYLKSADQRFRAHVALFPAYTPTITPPAASTTLGTILRPKPILKCSPRYQVAAHGQTVNLYGADSYNRGGQYVGDANITFALAGGSSGSVTDNGNGTATYTAPGSGSGVAKVNITVTNVNGSKTGFAYIQYPKTTYDETIADIATIQGSLTQHGWKVTLRARGGNLSDFVEGKRILVHVEDTWAGTTNTFGGYQYPEGVFVGYITELQYFEDWSGEYWLGIEVQSPYWILSQMKVGEMWWGTTAESGKFYLPGFAPVDSLWHFLNELTDFTREHDVTFWFDKNTIDDFITEESDLATLADDVMARTLSIAYCDRYGSLFCVPDPDVRADEYWGTPTSTYTLTRDFVTDYNLERPGYRVRKLVLAAFDKSKLGIYAVSENQTAIGDEHTIRGLLCDQGATLASWAVQKRAQMNRRWTIEANHPLNHVLDLNNFVDAVFTAPAGAGGLTASGQAYAANIAYRPDVLNGGWAGRVLYLQRTEGQGEAETGTVSSWGGTGSNWTGRPPWTGTGIVGSGTGGWITSSGQPTSTFIHLFNFTQSPQGWISAGDVTFCDTFGIWEAGNGWKPQGANFAYYTTITPASQFAARTATGIRLYATVDYTENYLEIATNGRCATAGAVLTANEDVAIGGHTVIWTGEAYISGLALYIRITPPSEGNAWIRSAVVAGLGTDPF